MYIYSVCSETRFCCLGKIDRLGSFQCATDKNDRRALPRKFPFLYLYIKSRVYILLFYKTNIEKIAYGIKH